MVAISAAAIQYICDHTASAAEALAQYSHSKPEAESCSEFQAEKLRTGLMRVEFIAGMKERAFGNIHVPQKILVLCGADFMFQSHWMEKLVPMALRQYIHILPKSRKHRPTEAEMSSNMLIIAQGGELRSRELLDGLNRMACGKGRASIAMSVEKKQAAGHHCLSLC